MRKKCLVFICSILLILLVGCTKGSYTVKNGIELNTDTKMSMTYDKFNGHKETQVKVNEGETIDVSVNIITEKGTLDAYIAKDNDTDTANCSYEGKDIPTSSFSVTLSEQGTYTIRVDAKDHDGSYSFSWNK